MALYDYELIECGVEMFERNFLDTKMLQGSESAVPLFRGKARKLIQ
jgi:hypothetical protein